MPFGCAQDEEVYKAFLVKKFIKPLSFLTDKVLEWDLKAIAQLQPGPPDCERMNNSKNLIYEEVLRCSTR